MHLGTGYELWANTANNAVEKLDNIFSVMEEIKLLNPSRSTSTQIMMPSLFLLPHQTAPLVQ